MLWVISLVTQKIAVGSCVKKCLEACFVPFSCGKGDGAVRKAAADPADKICEPVSGKGSVLTALEYEGAQAKDVPLVAAGKDLILVKTVTAGIPVAPADAAVEAVVPAVIGKLDKPPHKNILAVIEFLFLSRQ